MGSTQYAYTVQYAYGKGLEFRRYLSGSPISLVPLRAHVGLERKHAKKKANNHAPVINRKKLGSGPWENGGSTVGSMTELGHCMLRAKKSWSSLHSVGELSASTCWNTYAIKQSSRSRMPTALPRRGCIARVLMPLLPASEKRHHLAIGPVGRSCHWMKTQLLPL